MNAVSKDWYFIDIYSIKCEFRDHSLQANGHGMIFFWSEKATGLQLLIYHDRNLNYKKQVQKYHHIRPEQAFSRTIT